MKFVKERACQKLLIHHRRSIENESCTSKTKKRKEKKQKKEKKKKRKRNMMMENSLKRTLIVYNIGG